MKFEPIIYRTTSLEYNYIVRELIMGLVIYIRIVDIDELLTRMATSIGSKAG